MSSTTNSTLYVDLDGTLTHSDLLLESFLRLISNNFFYLFLTPVWLLKGKANLKRQIANRVDLRIDLLPFNQLLLKFLESEKPKHKQVILISGSNQKFVAQVADHFEVFDGFAGSSDEQNLKGKTKLDKIRILTGDEPFSYAGNDKSDLEVWRYAQEAIVVNADETLASAAAQQSPSVKVIGEKPRVYENLKQALRLHQWAKNLLLFLPLLLSQQVRSPELILLSLAAFASFSFCASSVYLLNDLLDLEHDRQHKIKSNRPFAAGNLALKLGLIACPLLLLLAVLIALVLPIEFLIVLASYYSLTLLYSFYLKAIAIVDVIVLACLYTLRLIAGAAAISVIPTFWLLAFSMFFFMSLAIVKRYTELSNLRLRNKKLAAGRGYQASDLEMLSMLGSASGFMAVLVFALYINADDTLRLYGTPQILWLICPLLLYLVSRIWLYAHRGKLDEDPVVFAITDRTSQLVVLLCAVLVWLATGDWL